MRDSLNFEAASHVFYFRKVFLNIVDLSCRGTATVNKATAKEQEKIDGFFNQYADKAEDHCIGMSMSNQGIIKFLCRPEGIEALCEDLGVPPTDVRILLLAWKLQAARQGYFSLMVSPYNFKDFYTFSFKYCLTEPRQKTLDLETACQMLSLVLGSRPHVASFLRFLQEQSEYKAMNLDQWSAFLRFCDEIKPDLRNYDESQAWPLLLDNYVEWAKKGMVTKS
nr:DCN1-like protein 2 isoform X7 [Physcomitrium patens]|eukprot:XP_024365510.1 DCN1-like protein 2 isoform X7 [Physcomitrella patens]